jgi:hypothetical protein
MNLKEVIKSFVWSDPVNVVVTIVSTAFKVQISHKINEFELTGLRGGPLEFFIEMAKIKNEEEIYREIYGPLREELFKLRAEVARLYREDSHLSETIKHFQKVIAMTYPPEE